MNMWQWKLGKRQPKPHGNLKAIVGGLLIALVLILAYEHFNVEPSPNSYSVSGGSSPPDNYDITGYPSVTDGDTIRIGDVRIRLHGIDAPEASQTCTKGGAEYDCGRASTKYLSSLIGSGSVGCKVLDTDKYSRKVAVCFNEAGQDLNSAIVSSGQAIAYLYYTDDYEQEQELAKASGVGVWAGSFVEPFKWRKGERLTKQAVISQCNIKGNVSSKGVRIFHVPSGQYYSQTKIDTSKGEKWFCSESEALNAGWRKSKR